MSQERSEQLRAAGAVYCGRLLRQPEGYDAEVWGHDNASSFRGGRRIDGVYSMALVKEDEQCCVAEVAWVSTPETVAVLRSRGLLSPVDSTGTLRPDWVGLGVWEKRRGERINFDVGAFIYSDGRRSALSWSWSERCATEAGFTRVDAPKPEPAPATPGLTYVGTAYGVRVSVGSRDAIEDENWIGFAPLAWRKHDVCGEMLVDCAAKTLAVTPEVLAVLDTWVEWTERVGREKVQVKPDLEIGTGHGTGITVAAGDQEQVLLPTDKSAGLWCIPASPESEGETLPTLWPVANERARQHAAVVAQCKAALEVSEEGRDG